MAQTHRTQPLLNPYYQALCTEQAPIALINGPARRFPADVIPFAALEHETPAAMHALVDLLDPGETLYVTANQLPAHPAIEHLQALPGLQFHYPADPETISASEISLEIRQLSAADAPAMVALTDAAFPGFFRTRTYTLGDYFGIHRDGQLIAMAGERLCLPGLRELSAICTHPSHTGQGYAARLSRHLLHHHAAQGLRSFLHVLADNHRAIALYERLGFINTTPILFHHVRRKP